MAWDEGTIVSARGWDVLSQKIKDLCGTSGLANWSFVENIPAGTGLGKSGSTNYSVDVFKCAGAGTDGHGEGDFFFMLEIPVTDLPISSSIQCAEDYEGGANKRFRRVAPASTSATAVGDGWRSDTYAQLAQAFRHTNTAYQTLPETGFSYMIKMTNKAIFIILIAGTVQLSRGVVLMESIVTNLACPDTVPVMIWTGAATGNSVTRVPGTGGVALGSSGWGIILDAWSRPVNYGILPILTAQGDLYHNHKIFTSRIFCRNRAAITAAVAAAQGLARGFWPDDFLFVPAGGTVYLGDTLEIDLETFVVIGYDSSGTNNYIITPKS